MTSVERPHITTKELTKFISQHAAWKIRLDRALHDGAADLQCEEVRRDDGCEFGKWLQAVEASERQNPHYQEARTRHAEFHRAAAAAVALLQQGRREEGERALDLNGDFFKASSALTLAMMAWKKTLPE